MKNVKNIFFNSDYKNIDQFLKDLTAPIEKHRTFVVDYRDDKENYFYKEIGALGYEDESQYGIGVESIIDTLKTEGYTVVDIFEVLNGLTYEDVKSDPKKSEGNVQFIYIDKAEAAKVAAAI